ncbi:hypothetical protein XANCAGTX0491_001159 [Xanthoria calcicola]
MRIILSIAVAALLTATVNGQSPSSSTSSTSPARSSSPSSAAVVVPGTSTHTYLGCYNETTGDASTGNRRALADGTMNATDTMTVQRCLKFCGDKPYAGLEYGRECWCALSLNPLSQKLPDSQCNLGCMGNATQICGGSLTLTMYNRIPGAKSLATPLLPRPGSSAIMGLGVLLLLNSWIPFII